MKATRKNVRSVLLALLEAAGVGAEIHWRRISEVVKAYGLVVENWMMVRDCLQELINAGRVVRVADVHTERYVLLSLE